MLYSGLAEGIQITRIAPLIKFFFSENFKLHLLYIDASKIFFEILFVAMNKKQQCENSIRSVKQINPFIDLCSK